MNSFNFLYWSRQIAPITDKFQWSLRSVGAGFNRTFFSFQFFHRSLPSSSLLLLFLFSPSPIDSLFPILPHSLIPSISTSPRLPSHPSLLNATLSLIPPSPRTDRSLSRLFPRMYYLCVPTMLLNKYLSNFGRSFLAKVWLANGLMVKKC